MDDEWITTSEATQISGYHPEYLRELIRLGKIEGKKFGILWQVNKMSLITYLKEAGESDDKRHGPKKP